MTRNVCFFLIWIFLVFKIVGVQPARILAVVPTPSYSHQVAFRPLWRELAKKGHDVTLITTDKMDVGNLTNIKQIDVSFTYEILKKNDFSNLANTDGKNPLKFIPQVIEMFNEVIDAEFSHKEVQQLINDKNQHFDLVMAEVFIPTVSVYAQRFNCPLIGIFSMDAHSLVHMAIGNPVHPIAYPDGTIPYERNTGFMDRLKNTVTMTILNILMEYFVISRHEVIVKKHFGKDIPPLPTILSNMHLQNVRPVGPNTIYIGGSSHIGDPEPLPKDLQSFLDNAKNGAIYFSLGSNIQSKDLPGDLVANIIEVLSSLPYSILWKFEAEDLPNKPDNVKIMKWVPQHDVLRHPNVKLFILQGGLQSTQEALVNHIPMVVLPFFGDQLGNAKKIAMEGLGLHVNPYSLSKDVLKKSIVDVISEPKYRNRVKEFHALSMDEPMPGLELGVWWAEYVIRHKGAAQLKNHVTDIPSWQYYLLDVMGVLCLVLFVSLYVVKKIVMGVLKVGYNLVSGGKKVKTN